MENFDLILRKFKVGDYVKYSGNSLRSELGSKIGEIVAYVDGNIRGYIVEFGDGSYIVDVNNLSKNKAQEQQGLQIEKRIKRLIAEADKDQ